MIYLPSASPIHQGDGAARPLVNQTHSHVVGPSRPQAMTDVRAAVAPAVVVAGEEARHSVDLFEERQHSVAGSEGADGVFACLVHANHIVDLATGLQIDSHGLALTELRLGPSALP